MAKNRRKRKSRARYVVLGILVLFIIAVGTVTITNWDNIQAGYAGLTSDPEEIEAKQAEKKAKMEESLGVGDGFTEEEMTAAQEAIASILPESLAEFITGSSGTAAQSGSDAGASTGDGTGTGSTDGSGSSGGSSAVAGDSSSGTTSDGSGSATGSTSTGTAGTGSSGSSSTGTDSSGSGSSSGSTSSGTESGSSTDAITRKYTAQLYALEGVLEGKINSITSSAKSQYLALPAEERTSSNRSSIISSALEEAESLEDNCDAAVDTILSNMQSELKAAGGDTSAVSELREYYESEKASKKAAAISAMKSA